MVALGRRIQPFMIQLMHASLGLRFVLLSLLICVESAPPLVRLEDYRLPLNAHALPVASSTDTMTIVLTSLRNTYAVRHGLARGGVNRA